MTTQHYCDTCYFSYFTSAPAVAKVSRWWLCQQCIDEKPKPKTSARKPGKSGKARSRKGKR